MSYLYWSNVHFMKKNSISNNCNETNNNKKTRIFFLNRVDVSSLSPTLSFFDTSNPLLEIIFLILLVFHCYWCYCTYWMSNRVQVQEFRFFYYNRIFFIFNHSLFYRIIFLITLNFWNFWFTFVQFQTDLRHTINFTCILRGQLIAFIIHHSLKK